MHTTRRTNLRKYVLVGGSVALTVAAAYQIYNSDAYGRSKRYLTRLRHAVQKYTDALSTGGDIISSILLDLQRFLQSDTNDMPTSLKQLAKILQSPEFTTTTTSTVTSIYRGVSHAQNQYTIEEAPPFLPMSSTSTIDKILDALLSDRGHSLVSVAVSMAAKNMVSAYVEATARSATTQQQSDNTDKLLAFLSTHQGQQLAVMSVAAFASNGMRVYMDKSLDVNFYEDLFSSLSRPEHLEAVKQCVSVFARDIVGAYLNNTNGHTTILGDEEPSSVSRSALLHATRVVDYHQDGQTEEQHEEQETIPSITAAPNEEQASSNYNEGITSPSGSTSTSIPARRGAQDAADDGDAVRQTNVSPATVERVDDGSGGVVRTAAHDDLDSDSILHAAQSRKKGRPQPSSSTRYGDMQWISAVGKEVLNVSKDPAGREAIAAVVGSATREVATAVTRSLSRELMMTWFVVVFVVGVVSALLGRYVVGWVITHS